MSRPPLAEAIAASEVARQMGVHINTVKRIPPAELPYFRVTSRGDRRYFVEDVIAYVVTRRVAG